LEIAIKKKAGLIIVGMKEGDKGFRKMLGSTATGLARKTSIPLVIVPEKVKYSEISSIALANESDLEPDADHHLLESLEEIAARFHSKLYLVRVTKNRVKAAYETLNRPFKLIRMMRTLDPSYGTIEGRSVPEALNHFIEGYHINMLAMLPHKHSLLERWFVKSATRSVVFETQIPLLILPDLHVKQKDHRRVQKEILL
jgi:nucleotide-binding universal stress UspA family protein